MADFKDLEILVAKIQKQLSPDAEIIHNAQMPGRKSGRTRQIDVLVRQRIGQYEMLIVLDCKDYARPVDVKGVEEFHGMVDDVGAHKAALVCPKGFTAAAKTRAAGLQIELYSPVDTDPHKWQAKVSAPVICDFRSAAVSFRVQTSAPMPFRMAGDFFSSAIARSLDGSEEFGSPMVAAVKNWNEGRYPAEEGEHRDLAIFPTAKVLTDNGYGAQIPVTLTASILVERALFFGQIPISQVSGFRDELSGKVITNAFTTGIFDPNDVMENWTQIASEADAPTLPMFKLVGAIAWQLGDDSRYYI